jgi:hypothetical protein
VDGSSEVARAALLAVAQAACVVAPVWWLIAVGMFGIAGAGGEPTGARLVVYVVACSAVGVAVLGRILRRSINARTRTRLSAARAGVVAAATVAPLQAAVAVILTADQWDDETVTLTAVVLSLMLVTLGTASLVTQRQ